jgi:hypothetical protein
VFERYRVPLYKQAGFKPYIIASMMLTNHFEKPAEILRKMESEKKPRVV